MGSRRLGRITNLFLGSVSDRVAHRARLPVLIVHYHGQADPLSNQGTTQRTGYEP